LPLLRTDAKTEVLVRDRARWGTTDKPSKPVRRLTRVGRFDSASASARCICLIGESPCRGIKLPRVGRVEQRFWTALEVERLACEIDPQFSTLIYAGAYLGARWGELVGLKRERVNLLKRQVAIAARSRKSVAASATSKKQRQVPLGDLQRSRLSSVTCCRPSLGTRFRLEVTAPSSYSSRPTGPSCRRSNFRRGHFKRALGRADLDPGFRFHDLRHTCAALMIEQGAHPMEVKARLGHASIKTTVGPLRAPDADAGRSPGRRP
jgi:integrase